MAVEHPRENCVLSVGYLTSRREPQWKWFLDSFNRECKGNYENIQLLVCDFWSQAIPHENWTEADVAKRRDEFFKLCHTDHVKLFPPKPTPWAGPHRLTKNDYFHAAACRNTIVCYAQDGYVAFIDDLSVLIPGWLDCVLKAMNGGYIICGAYKKVLALVVEKGEVVYYREHKAGLDSRYAMGLADRPVPLPGGAMYGCSLAMPVDAILDVNGWNEDADCCGVGSEDYLCGLLLEQRGWKIMYDIRMQTLESEERHHWQKPMKRVIEKKEGDSQDASWALLNPVVGGKMLKFKNYFGEEGIAGLRQRVLAGEPFPIMTIPEHSFYSGIALKDL
jgi:hypothetical protein